MAAKRKVSQAAQTRRQDILDAAERLFALKGFTGATTKALAREAGVHEAVLFRHFDSKRDLYQATLEQKLARNRPAALEKMEACAEKRDDRGFFEALALGLLTRFEKDPSIPRLILYSALDGQEPPEVVRERQLRVEKPTLEYVALRVREGAFRKMEPDHAVIAFGSMLFGYVVRQQVVGMSGHKAYDRRKMAKSLVRIFLEGVRERAAD